MSDFTAMLNANDFETFKHRVDEILEIGNLIEQFDINSIITALRDSLNIQKYRSDYENVIINMNDYLGSLMLQQVLNINADGLNEENILLALL